MGGRIDMNYSHQESWNRLNSKSGPDFGDCGLRGFFDSACLFIPSLVFYMGLGGLALDSPQQLVLKIRKVGVPKNFMGMRPTASKADPSTTAHKPLVVVGGRYAFNFTFVLGGQLLVLHENWLGGPKSRKVWKYLEICRYIYNMYVYIYIEIYRNI